MKKHLLSRLFQILLLITGGTVSAQTYNMGNLGTISGACGGMFYDSGGPTGNYSNGENSTMTFCAPAGQVITFTFSSFTTENSWEHLYVYNGPTTSSPMIGNYTGSTSPGTISSTVGGCLTFAFTSDGSVNYAGWAATISCGTAPPPSTSGDNCGSATPFCTGTTYTFTNNTGVASLGTINCLYSTPNPVWYFMQIQNPGNMTIHITQTNGSGTGIDVDFNLWGPFTSQAAGCAAIAAGTAPNVDCSYSAAAQEDADITGATTGQFYILLLTNYSNQPGTISFTNTAGAATTNCNILCTMTGLTATPSACNTATGQYSVSGQISLSYPPTTGTLTVSSSCGGSTTVPLPWTSPISYTLPGLTPTGGACNITATFSADPTCTLTQPYTSPAPCNSCTATAGPAQTVCAGSTFNLTSSTVAGATYSWSGPSFTSSSQNPTGVTAPTTAGTYTYTVTATAGSATCTSTTVITVNPIPAAPVAVDASRCGPGTVNLSVTGCSGTADWYTAASGGTAIASGASFTTPSIASTTTYYVSCTSGGCTGPRVPVTATINPIPVSSFTPSANSCLAGNSFSFTNTGTTGATYSWNFGGSIAPNTSTAASPTGVSYAAAGTYTITLTTTTAAGCTSTTTATVTVYPAPTAISATAVTATCGLNNGSINIAGASGGSAPYSYSVDGGGFSTTTSYTSLAPGTHTIIVRDANNCTYTTTVTVPNSPGPTALAVTSVNSTCGLANGIINIGATTGGTAPYVYSVNGGPFSGTTSYTGFAAGTYTVVVRDANNCTFTTSVTVTNTPGPTALAVSTINSTCGSSNGTINIGAVTGGTPGYTYSINGGAFTTTTSYTSLAAGTYTIVVRDANNCSFTVTATVANTPGPTAVATTVVNATCGNSNGSITIGATTGGTAPYMYSVNGSAFTTSTSYTGFAAGTYSVVVRDANNCTFTTSVTIINSGGPTALGTASTNASCGSSTGTVTLGPVTGGIAPYTYSLNGSPFTSTTNYTGLASGTYTAIVRDANNCTFTTTVTVGSNGSPTAIAATTTNSTCGAANGVITLGAVTGGIAPYTYSVNGSPFTTTTTYGSLTAGTYTVVVRDVNNCSFTTTVTVINSPGPTALAVSTVNSTCGASNGQINIGVVTGGSPAYTYSVNGSPFTSTTAYTGFGAGTYTVIVRDANNCTFTTTATVANTPGPTALASTTVNSTCGNSNGSITLGAVTGGTPAYVYSFNGGAFSATSSYTALAAGTYTITVRDANNCTFSITVPVTNIPGPTALATTFTNATCGNSNGTITIGATTGGTGPYTYSFNGGSFNSTTSYTALAAGTYTIVVQDANGCQFTTTRTITNVPGPTAVVVNTVNASCGASNGSVTLGAVTGGTAPYQYSVNGSGFTTTTNYTGLAANSYPVIVQDANGCTFTTTAIINNSSGPTALAVSTTNAACGASTGTISIGAVTGGLAPYTYSVNGSGFTSTTNYTGFAAGSYTVIVRDANNCTFSTTAVVNPTLGPTAMALSTVNSTCGSANGVLNIGTVTGGTTPYTYSLNGGAFSGTLTYSGLAATTYTVTVNDANGCQFTTTTTVANTAGPTAVASTVVAGTCGTANGSITLGAVTGGTPAYTYSFAGSGFTATTSYTGLAAGTYAIVVRDANNCTFNTSLVVSNVAGPTALASTSANSTCGNANGSITLGAVTGGTAPYTYSFNGGGFGTTSSYTALSAGTYTITVQDANGCQFTVNPVVGNTAGPTAIASTTTNSSCGASNGAVTLGAVTGGTAPYTYSFAGGSFGTATSFTGLAANSYPVVVQDANGCQFTTSVVVSNSSGPTALAVTFTNSTCGNSNGTVTIGAATGGIAPLSYSFNGGAFSTTTSYMGLAAGSYTVVVRDANNCTFSTTVTVSNIAGPSAMSVSSTNSTCGNPNGSVTAGIVTGGTAAYTYSLNGSPFTATTNYTALAAGTYTVTVSDANSCTFSATATVTNLPGPTAIATTITNATCGNANGAVTLGAVTGGTPAYTYSFDGGAFTSAISYTSLSATTHTVTVQDANGCTFTVNPVVPNTPGPTAQPFTVVHPTCGNSNGAINIGATTGGTPAYTYSLDGGGSTATTSYTNLAAGTHTVVVTDANGCTFTVNPALNNIPGPTAAAVSTTSSTCGGANGAITIGTVTGGTAPYSYSVNGSPFTSTLSYTGLVANSYPVIVQDANGCQLTTTATVTDLSGLVAVITAQANVGCNGGNNGGVTITASGSTAPYSYSINGGPFVGSGTFGTLTAGSYTITAKDANGCTVTVPVTITEPPVLSGLISAQTNISCFGASNGSVTVSAAGGAGSYSYSINGGPFGPSATFMGLTLGSHTVTIRDANNCTFNIPVTITQPPALVLTPASSNATCTAANGSASITVSGGTPSYTYSWSPGGATTPSITNVVAGNYTVIVTDAAGCSQSQVINVGQNLGGTASISASSNVSCIGSSDGSATVSMAGATPSFTYGWSNGQNTVTASGLGAGSYTVTVTDGNGCVATASIVITEPSIITNTFTNVNVTCFGGSNGSSTINPAGGTAPYTYLWTPGGQTTQTAVGLSAGTYTCTITDANGCTRTATTAITQPSGMNLTSNSVDANCNLANGSATVNVAGGVGPYTYSWSSTPVQTTSTATALPANSYVVTVTDANSCVQTLGVTINNLAGPTATIASSTNVSCNGENDGSASVAISGGTSPYSFIWSNGQTLPTATNLTAGTYTLNATDVNGCTASTAVTITEPAPLITNYTFTNPGCAGAFNGTISVVTAGGTGPYNYSWTPGGMTTATVSGLAAGSYTVQTTDANSCSNLVTVILTNPAPVAATTSVGNVTCSGMCNGYATVNPTSGTGPYTYQWSDISSQTTGTATGLCAGTYTVTVTDAGGCTATATANITSPAGLSVAITSSGNVSCFNACDGFAGATVTGGSGPYSFVWMPGSTAGSNVNNLCAATYTVTVTDANGCSANTTVNITQPVALTASITNSNVTCYDACDASATAVYNGGTGPYTFLWTPGLQTTPTISGICAGVHNLTVTDANGCEANASVVVTQPTILAVNTTTTNSNCGVNDGSACASIIGGSPPFTYEWNDPALQTTSCANSLNAGIYTISVTDSHGCSVTNVATVNDNTAPVVTIPTSTNVTCFGAANGSAQADITGGTLPYNIVWTPSAQTTPFASGLSGGIYAVTVTDGAGCVGSATVTINEPSLLVSGITASQDVSCNLSCDGFATVLAGGGTSPYTYLWNDAATQSTSTATGLCAQSYTVTTTDANGCTSQSTVTITEPTAITIALVSATNVSCNGGNNGAITISVNGGTPGYTYQWIPSVGSGPNVTNLVAGSYQVIVTDANGCSRTTTIDITEPAAIVLTPSSLSSTCSNPDGTASVTVAGGVGPYVYAWTPGALTTATISGMYAGTYSVTVTDANGCSSTTNTVITDQPAPVISAITFTPPICSETPTATATVIPNGGTPSYTYQWSGVGSQTTQTASAFTAGTYTVTVSDANHCTVQGVVIIPDPNPVGVIPLSTPDTICIGQMAQITAAGFGGTPGYTYQWSPSLGTTGGPFTVNPVTTTGYTVYAVDANGCLSPQQSISVYVNPALTVSATDVTMCSGSSVNISATATGGTGGPYTYNWSNGVSGDSQTVSPTVGSSPMNYIVTVDDGCSFPAFDTATVIVHPLAVSFMTVNDTAGCEDFTVQFTGLSDIGTQYTWDFGDGSGSQTGTPVTHTYATPGQYDVTLTVMTAMGCYSTITTNSFIDVYATPVAEFSFSPNEIYSTNPVVTFTNQSLGGETYAWDFIHQYPYSGMYGDTLENTSFSYPDTGVYNVQLIVFNSFGCSDTVEHQLDIIPEYVLYAPNAFTPTNHDGINDMFMPKGLGIDPNNFQMSIYDRWGNRIFQTTDVNKGWDGRANGGKNIAQIDTYVWKIDTQDFRGNKHEYIGHVTIVK